MKCGWFSFGVELKTKVFKILWKCPGGEFDEGLRLRASVDPGFRELVVNVVVQGNGTPAVVGPMSGNGAQSNKHSILFPSLWEGTFLGLCLLLHTDSM